MTRFAKKSFRYYGHDKFSLQSFWFVLSFLLFLEIELNEDVELKVFCQLLNICGGLHKTQLIIYEVYRTSVSSTIHYNKHACNS